MKKVKICSIIGVLSVSVALLLAGSASAWYMGRLEHYTLNNLPDKATLNALEDNPFWGDERQFVRIVEKYKDAAYARTLTLEPGKQYEVYIYYNNDAKFENNLLGVSDGVHTGEEVGEAVDKMARAITSFPKELKKDEERYIQAWVSYDTKSEAKIIASDDMKLFPIEGSAKLYNHWNPKGIVLPSTFFTSSGTPIGLSSMNGIIPGSAKYSGHISYTIQTTSPDGSIPNLPERIAEMKAWDAKHRDNNDSLPAALPNTGTMQILLGVVLMVIIAAAVVLLTRSGGEIRKIRRNK